MTTLPSLAPEPPIGSSPTRRRWLFAGAAVAAAAAGAGLAWWRLQPRAVAPGALDGPGDLWSRVFEQPDGGMLAMQSFRGKPLLVNFWATWCPPCVEELPLLDRFHRVNAPKGFQVAGIAIDQASAVRSFLSRMPLGFPVALAGAEGLGLVKSLGNLAGGLPFSVVLGADGQLLHRKMGKVTEAELTQWALLR